MIVFKIVRSIGLVIMLPASLGFVLQATILSEGNHYYTSGEESHLWIVLLGCTILLMGMFGDAGLWCSRLMPHDAKSRAWEICRMCELMGIVLLLFGLVFVLISPFLSAYHRRTSVGPISDSVYQLGLLCLLGVPVGMLAMCAARLSTQSLLLCRSNSPGGSDGENQRKIRKWEMRGVIFGWITWLMMSLILLVGILASRRWPLIWPQIGSFEGWNAVYAATYIACVIGVAWSVILWIVCRVRISQMVEGRAYLSKVGLALGLAVSALGIWRIDDIVNVVQHPSRYYGHEIWAMLIGGGVAILTRSLLGHMGIGRGLLVALGGMYVALYSVVSAEAWFSPDVPVLWSNGFLGAFVPGLALLAWGFDGITSKNEVDSSKWLCRQGNGEFI